MILTQCFRDLGSPSNWLLVGAFADIVENSKDCNGYGLGYRSCLEVLDDKLQAEHGAGVRLINVKFERVSGSAHPSYHNKAFFVSGDLYIEPTGSQVLRNGLVELNYAIKS